MKEFQAPTYQFSPVHTGITPKRNGEPRNIYKLRKKDKKFIKKTINPMLYNYLSPILHPYSIGCIPGRSSLHGIAYASWCVNSGYRHCVKFDLAQCFDNIQHKLLQRKLHAAGLPASWSNLIMAHQKTPFIKDNLLYEHPDGLYSGSPCSPLLTNFYLSEADWFCNNMGWPFFRYLDDIFIFSPTEAKALQVFQVFSRFLTGYLQMPINQDKSKIFLPEQLEILGYAFEPDSGRFLLKPSDKSLERLLSKVDLMLQDWTKHRDVKEFVRDITTRFRGWRNYFQYVQYPAILEACDEHCQRMILLSFFRIYGGETRQNQISRLDQILNHKNAAKAIVSQHPNQIHHEMIKHAFADANIPSLAGRHAKA